MEPAAWAVGARGPARWRAVCPPSPAPAARPCLDLPLPGGSSVGSAHSDGPALTTKVKILSGPRALQTDSLGLSDSQPEPGCSHRDLPENRRRS